MKKLFIALLSLVMIFAIVGCDKGWTSTVTDYSGEVSSNGGFLVEKGDWVYFINGIEDYTSENTFGQVVKGAVVRAKKAELSSKDKTVDVVVPEIVYSTQKGNGNGLFIFGDYIYYATPCSEKNANGDVKNTEIEYMRTKLDGSETKVIANLSTNSDPFRFVQLDNVCYLAVYTSNDDGDKVIRVYNADTQSLVKESKKVTSYAFPDDLNAKYAYYTTSVHNEALDEDESFNAVYRIALDGSEDVEILNGAGTYSDSTNGIGIAGVLFDITKNTGADLYIKETSVQTSSVAVYKGIKQSDIVTAANGETPATKLNYDKLITIDNGSSLANSIFAETSIYIDLDAIVYFDANYGMMKYDYNNASNEAFGREIIYYNETINDSAFKFIKDGIAYFCDLDGVYYSLDMSKIIDLATGEVKGEQVEPKRLNYVNVTTDWYQPEIVGNYFVCAVDEDPYYGYIYAFDLTETDGKTDEEIEDYIEDIEIKDREHILARLDKLVGVMSDADKELLDTFMDENYPAEEETSSDSSSSN